MTTHYVTVQTATPGPRGQQGAKGEAGGFDLAGEARISQLEADLDALTALVEQQAQTIQGLVNHNLARGEVAVALDVDGVPYFNPTVVS